MGVLKIFIVEDDLPTAKMLQYHLSLNPENDVDIFTSGKDCIDNLYRKPDVICLDYYLPGENAEEILKKIKKHNPDIPVIVVSGQQEISTAVELLKKGIYDYVVKDINTKERLWNIVNNIRNKDSLEKRVSELQEEVEEKYDLKTKIVGESPAIKKVFPLIHKAATSDLIVSITGDTGTGKELVAKAIHYNSSRKNKPFVAINVAAVPNDLIESELFGFEKGAFTGAVKSKSGKFEEAQKGTIFLDEIGEMDPMMQAKLLRVIQEQELTRIGCNKKIELDVRIIISTHKDLPKEVKNGNFREDLYYRLLGIPIKLPPLKERGNDTIVLANYFIKEYSKKNKTKAKKITSDAVHKLLSHDYPGNVRELKAIIELAVVMSEGEFIKSDDIQVSYTNFMQEILSHDMTLKEYNKLIVKHYLIKYDNKIREVAKKLGIGKSTIYRMFPNKV